MAGSDDGETIHSMLQHDDNGKNDYRLREEGPMLLVKCLSNVGGRI
ncbi:hypothetical protein HRH25_14450 [Flavisolibacter sp. BT320]|nr:hypothetical protein [Flavisolibacter longurius]